MGVSLAETKRPSAQMNTYSVHAGRHPRHVFVPSLQSLIHLLICLDGGVLLQDSSCELSVFNVGIVVLDGVGIFIVHMHL